MQRVLGQRSPGNDGRGVEQCRRDAVSGSENAARGSGVGAVRRNVDVVS